MMRVFLLAVFLSLAYPVAFAQTVALSGIVTDQMGAVIPGAKVGLVSSSSRSVWTETNVDGRFRIQAEPGIYTVRVGHPMFETFEVKDFSLNSQANRLDVVLMACAGCTLIEDLVWVPEPIDSVTSNDVSGQLRPRPLLGTLRFCGTVRDEHGATIPDVLISLKPEKRNKTGKAYQFRSDADGNFEMVVTDGLYKITFSKESFRKVELKNQLRPSNPDSCIEIRMKSRIPPHQIT